MAELKPGDTCYWLAGGGFGEFPLLMRGTVIKQSAEGFHYLVQENISEDGSKRFVEKDSCYPDAKSLLMAFRNHLNDQTLKVENCVYDW